MTWHFSSRANSLITFIWLTYTNVLRRRRDSESKSGGQKAARMASDRSAFQTDVDQNSETRLKWKCCVSVWYACESGTVAPISDPGKGDLVFFCLTCVKSFTFSFGRLLVSFRRSLPKHAGCGFNVERVTVTAGSALTCLFFSRLIISGQRGERGFKGEKGERGDQAGTNSGIQNQPSRVNFFSKDVVKIKSKKPSY